MPRTQLPMQGSFSAGINRSTWNSEYLGSSSNGTIDMVNALAAVHPLSKLALSVSADYSDNLTGQLIQSVVAAGGVVTGLNSNASSDSLDLMSVASYSPATNLQTSAFYERRTQDFLGVTYGVNSYGASATYGHALLNGTFNSSLTVTANSSDNTGADTLGISASENYSSLVLGWHVNESFGYAQNVQTLLVTYMNSFYNYSGNARRNWGQFNFSAGADGARTALTEQAGTANSSQSYNASIGLWRLDHSHWQLFQIKRAGNCDGCGTRARSGAFAHSAIEPGEPFRRNSYSFGLSSTPVKRLIIAGVLCQVGQQHFAAPPRPLDHICKPERYSSIRSSSIRSAS